MPIPDFQSVMLPLLQHSADGTEHTLPETEDFLAQYFKLGEAERNELLSSGRQSRFGNRVGWAKQHLMKAGLLESPRRSVFRISERGNAVLGKQPERISMAFLKQFPEYLEFLRPSNNNDSSVKETVEELEIIEKSPKEVLDDAYSRLNKALQQELLEKVRQSHWRFFERLVVELLVEMGYGGSVKDAGRVTQPTNDGGIDGVIKEDKLGLDVIYLQAKRFEAGNKVGRPEIQSFVGALEEKRAMKGVFITTSSFASTANEYVKNISKKVILIDGEQLADFMIEYGVGVSTVDVYKIKRLDSDYFDSEV